MRRSNPLALAVLACLTERPMHPYEIATTLREREKQASIKLNYGSLYSVVELLQRSGLIEARETVQDGRRPARTIYQITLAGLHEFTDWLSLLLSEPVKEYTQFEAGLSLLPGVEPDEAVRLLTARCDRLELQIRAAESLLAFAVERKLARLFWIEAEYQLVLRRAELSWVRRLAGEIADGSLGGLAEWQSFHDGGGVDQRDSDQPDDQAVARAKDGAIEGGAIKRPAHPPKKSAREVAVDPDP